MPDILSPDQARRALYIDFEGTMTDPASFLGIACEGEWEVIVVEEALWPTVSHGARGGSIRQATIREALTELRNRAKRESRTIVAWSTRELDEIQSALPDASPEAAWWTANLINALPIAKRCGWGCRMCCS